MWAIFYWNWSFNWSLKPISVYFLFLEAEIMMVSLLQPWRTFLLNSPCSLSSLYLRSDWLRCYTCHSSWKSQSWQPLPLICMDRGFNEAAASGFSLWHDSSIWLSDTGLMWHIVGFQRHWSDMFLNTWQREACDNLLKYTCVNEQNHAEVP